MATLNKGDVAVIAGKVVTKVGMNMAVPGSGSLVEFGQAIYDFSKGNFISGIVNVTFGVMDLISLGVVSATRDAAKETGKRAAVEATKASMKGASKEVTRQAGRRLATDFGKGMVETITEESFKDVTKTSWKSALVDMSRATIASGEKDAFKAMLGSATESTVNKAFQGFSGNAAKQIFESSVAESACRDATKRVFQEATMKNEIMKNGVTSVISSVVRKVENN